MKNKIKLKKLLKKIFFLSIIVIVLTLLITKMEYHIYTKNFNNKISNIINEVVKKYPGVTEDELIKILNSKGTDTTFFKKYNIDIKEESVILENDKRYHEHIILNSIFVMMVTVLLTTLFLKFNANKDKEIVEITKYIEEINKKNYKLNIDEISEDELSILKNELYKITIMLKEQAENESSQKQELKKSLSDISHQLKTPLTSILIILDNLIEDSDMDKKTREDFIFDIKREINNINFLVQNLLKLSKIDTNSVKFINENVSLKYIAEEAAKRLAMLSDLKNVSINISCENDTFIFADAAWQIEAISNILKNCLEHSEKGSTVEVNIRKNKIYSEMIIEDHGSGIDKEDLHHIFERFYKGKDASTGSVGIGLALAKSIIMQAGGKIKVESTKGEGTKFIIRYY